MLLSFLYSFFTSCSCSFCGECIRQVATKTGECPLCRKAIIKKGEQSTCHRTALPCRFKRTLPSQHAHSCLHSCFMLLCFALFCFCFCLELRPPPPPPPPAGGDEEKKSDESAAAAPSVFDSSTSVEFHSKIDMLLTQLRMQRSTDPDVKSLVFTQFTATLRIMQQR